MNPKLIMAAAIAVIIGIIAWQIYEEGVRDERGKQTEAALNDAVESNKKSHTVGLDLINGNNTYAEKTHEIDQERAALPAAPLPDATRVRLRNARNQAGIAARQRILAGE